MRNASPRWTPPSRGEWGRGQTPGSPSQVARRGGTPCGGTLCGGPPLDPLRGGIRRKSQVSGTVYTPEPELFLIALEKVHGFLELLHGTVKGGGQEKHLESPRMPGVAGKNPYTILAGLIALDAAAVVIANGRNASGRNASGHG